MTPYEQHLVTVGRKNSHLTGGRGDHVVGGEDGKRHAVEEIQRL